MREFRDSTGEMWTVSLTARGHEAASRDHHLPEEYREGWLVFESSHGEKRRIAPVPPNWVALPQDELQRLCARATPQIHRSKERAEPADLPAPPPVPPPAPREPARSDPLRPELREMEVRLESALQEVCDAPPPAKLSTGELIRVEETLALAADAAKEAVSLRRKLRADEERAAGRAMEGERERPRDG